MIDGDSEREASDPTEAEPEPASHGGGDPESSELDTRPDDRWRMERRADDDGDGDGDEEIVVGGRLAALDAATMHELVRLEPPRFDRSDVASFGGVDPDTSSRWWRAMGFAMVPDGELAFASQDVAMVSELDQVLGAGLIDDTDVLRLARLMGASFARIADAQIALVEDLMRNERAKHADEASFDADEPLVMGTDDLAILDMYERSMMYVWRRHLLAALGRRMTLDIDLDGQAVAFADLTGFSRFTKKASSSELAEAIDTFEAVAFDVVSHGEGRVVKLIGDEVMFVASTLAQGVDICLDLIEALDQLDGMPPLHCGVAHGPTLDVGGDVFGNTVNLASRLTAVARPGMVAILRSARDELADSDDIVIKRVRRTFDLKGFGMTSIVGVRRAEVESDEDDD